MSTEDVAKMMEDAKAELLRRQNAELLGDRLAEVQDEFRDGGILPEHTSETWEQPTEVRDAYGRGDVVEWKGEHRRAKSGFVVCSPDCNEHWSDYVEPEEAPEEGEEPKEEAKFWDPTSPGVLVVGERVAYEGKIYVVRQAHSAKSNMTPDKTPTLYAKEA